MKYKIETNFNNNYNKYQCTIIFVNKKYNNPTNIYNNIINEQINKYKFIKKKYNIHKIKSNINKNQDIFLIEYNKKKLKYNILKILITKSLKIIKKKKYKNIIFLINNLNDKKLNWKLFNIIHITENLIYKYLTFKTKKKKILNKNIYFETDKINILKYKKIINNSKIISSGINKTKNLCNTPPNICNSNYILNKTYKYIIGKNTKISYLNEKKMKKLSMNAYLSVNKASSNEIKMIKIKYNNNKNKKPLILIGKGLTFDSGGLSIKSSLNMHEMKYDMSGAAVVWGIMYIINKLKLKLNIIGILCCAENMINHNSTRPGDVIKSLSGKTIEIINTDAEGRLVLCDTLTYIKKYNPSTVITIATLTGACLIALGNNISGLISNNNKLAKKLIKSGKKTKDIIWQLPLYKKYNKYLQSNIADIKNCSNSNYAGTITSACFLNFFTEKYKWAHIDIAGTAWNKNGATGRTVYLIIKFITKYIKKNK